MAPATTGVATGLTLGLVFVDACKAAVGGSDHCWLIVQSWRNACCGACCSAIKAWCCWMARCQPRCRILAEAPGLCAYLGNPVHVPGDPAPAMPGGCLWVGLS